MSFLADPPRAVYLALIAAVVLSLLAAFLLPSPPAPPSREKKKAPRTRTILFGISALAVLLLLVLTACDRFMESDKEQIKRKLDEMSAGVRERNLDRVFQHVSESFRYGTADKRQLRQAGERAQQAGQVTDIPIWDVNVEAIPSGATKATVVFRFKVTGNTLAENQFLCRASFVKDADGQWRLGGFEVFPPTGLKDPYTVPGLN